MIISSIRVMAEWFHEFELFVVLINVRKFFELDKEIKARMAFCQ